MTVVNPNQTQNIILLNMEVRLNGHVFLPNTQFRWISKTSSCACKGASWTYIVNAYGDGEKLPEGITTMSLTNINSVESSFRTDIPVKPDMSFEDNTKLFITSATAGVYGIPPEDTLKDYRNADGYLKTNPNQF